jgi:hypothetical protein
MEVREIRNVSRKIKGRFWWIYQEKNIKIIPKARQGYPNWTLQYYLFLR